MAVIIDRRLNPTGKNHINRQKFLERAKDQIKELVKKSVSDKSLKDIGSGENVKIKSKDISEPTFTKDKTTGNKEYVLPGNKKFSEGDTLEKQKKSDQDKGSEPSTGDSLDDFEFTLTRDEFLNYLFEDLELPDFIKESINVLDNYKYNRAGYTTSGSPANLSILKTFKNSIGRRLALSRPTDEEIEEARLNYINAQESNKSNKDIKKALELWEDLKGAQKRIPYIEENDLQYKHFEQIKSPSTQAVMFCLMDVSGSMGEIEKDIAKRFFLLLYLFLERKYSKIDIKFIRHTDKAEEVDERTFFYDTFSGGTLVSSGLNLIKEIINKSYSPSEWNIYIAQCTDGDNMNYDNNVCKELIINDLQPITQYYSYIQVSAYEDRQHFMMFPWAARDFSIWPTMSFLSNQYKNIVCRKISNQDQIWRVFRSLFEGTN